MLPTEDGWIDVSNFNLYVNPLPQEAFSTAPSSFALNEAVIAQLSNTSIDHGIEVSDYIRGRGAEYHLNLVIRRKAEIGALVNMNEDELAAYAEMVAPTAELFREPISYAFLESLQKLLGDRQTLYVSVTDKPRLTLAAGIKYADKEGTLYIPDDLPAIDERGMFKAGGKGEGDVFAKVQTRYRRFVQVGAGYQSLDADEFVVAKTVAALVKAVKSTCPVGFYARAVFEAAGLVYIKISKRQIKQEQLLSEHLFEAKSFAKKLTEVLKLEQEVADAVVLASEFHDAGKAHELWQLSSRGDVDGEALAKVIRFCNPSLLGGMRHELVSALYNPHITRLALWLIVSHHGRCRPQFEQSAYDMDNVAESAVLNEKLSALFETVQKEHGYWGLAYLESLVRAIDINAGD